MKEILPFFKEFKEIKIKTVFEVIKPVLVLTDSLNSANDYGGAECDDDRAVRPLIGW